MARRHVARYAVTFGLAGLYMPNSHEGVHEFITRKQLADYIRYTLRAFDMPASLFGEVGIRNRWRFIMRHGSSSAHFSLYYGEDEIAFHGLTDAEFDAALKAEGE